MRHLTHHTNHLTIVAIILLVLGLLIRYIVGRRRFNRRTIAGLQQFKNYNIAVLTTVLERLFNVIANLMIIGGIILYLIK